MNVSSDEEGHDDEAELCQTTERHGGRLMECHEDSSTSPSEATSQATALKKATTPRAARGGGECVQAGYAANGPREEHVGQHVDG